jgi:hypothetical protein
MHDPATCPACETPQIPDMDVSTWLPIHHQLCRAYSKNRVLTWEINDVRELIGRHIDRLCEVTEEEGKVVLQWFHERGMLKHQHRRTR